MIIESHIPRTHYPYSSLKICVSAQSMSHLTPARSQDLHLTSPSRTCLNPGPYVCISPPSWLLSTSIQVHKVASQLHPSTISNQSNFQDVHLTSFQVCKIASEVFYFFYFFFIFFFISNIFIQGKNIQPLAVLPCCPVYTHNFNTHKIHEMHKIHFRSKSPKMRNIIASVYEQCITIHIKYKW